MNLTEFERMMINNQERQIIATNGTTYAVRAFVLFLFYQLSAITIAFVLYSIALFAGEQGEPQPFFLFLALIVWVTGVFYSSSAGWREIKKSDI